MRRFIRILILLPLFVWGQEESTSFEKFQFVDLNGYYDTRDLYVFTMNAKLDFSPRLSYFTVSNFFSDPQKRDMNTYYMEHHFFFKPVKKWPIDLTQYWVSTSGLKNDYLRYGIRWNLHQTKGLSSFFTKINAKVFAAIYPISFCDYRKPTLLSQAQYVYRWNILGKQLKNRIYLGAFANQYFDISNPQIQFSWVTEHQLGIRIWEGLHLVAEYRYNAFWQKKTGIGLGFEYFHSL